MTEIIISQSLAIIVMLRIKPHKCYRFSSTIELLIIDSVDCTNRNYDRTIFNAVTTVMFCPLFFLYCVSLKVHFQQNRYPAEHFIQSSVKLSLSFPFLLFLLYTLALPLSILFNSPILYSSICVPTFI